MIIYLGKEWFEIALVEHCDLKKVRMSDFVWKLHLDNQSFVLLKDRHSGRVGRIFQLSPRVIKALKGITAFNKSTD